MIDENYLPAVKALLTQKYQAELVSLILFGSMIDSHKNGNSSTDIDLIIVLKDSCPQKILNGLQGELLGLQLYYGMYGSKFRDIFIAGLQTATGMFVNSFVCYYSDIHKKNFSKTFGVNRILAFLIAPQNSVWISLKQRHRIIMGKDIFQEWEEEVLLETSDILRSYVMNSMISLGALVLSVFGVEMSHFAMESIKWSLFTWRNRQQITSKQIQDLCEIYSSTASKFERRTLSAFLNYRKTMKQDSYLLFLAPLFILKLHNNLRKERVLKR